MEEKERFEQVEEGIGYAIKDNVSQRVYYFSAWDFDDLRDLLNQQDKEIKKLRQEKQQLKQSQKKLAVRELEKLFCNLPSKIMTFRDVIDHSALVMESGQVFKIINNRIKELRGDEK